MQRRKKEIKKMKRAIDNHDWELCIELCFKILYGLPFELQINLCCFMMKRYLLIFESRNPTIRCPRNLLNDVNLYFSKHGRSVVFDEEKKFAFSDEHFIFSFHALLLAYCHRYTTEILSSSVSCGINAVVTARGCNVWIADDPEVVKMWNDKNISNKKHSKDNPAFQAVCMREWNILLELFLEARVLNNTDEINLDKMEIFFEYWKDGELSLVVPETRYLLEKNNDNIKIKLKDIICDPSRQRRTDC